MIGIEAVAAALALFILLTIPQQLAHITTASEDEGADNDTEESQRESTLNSITKGLKYVFSRRDLALLLIAECFLAVGAGINNTVMIFFITEQLGLDPAHLAWLPTVKGIIQVAIGTLIVAYANRLPITLNLRIGGATMFAGALITAIAPFMAILILGVIINSIGNSPQNIGSVSYEQTHAKPTMLGRLRGLESSVTPIFFGAGYFNDDEGNFRCDVLRHQWPCSPSRCSWFPPQRVLATTVTLVPTVATMSEPADGGDGADISGTMELDDGCFYLRADGQLYLPVFSPDRVELVDGAEDGHEFVFNGRTLSDGEHVEFGGSSPPTPGDNYNIPETCDDNVDLWLVHPES